MSRPHPTRRPARFASAAVTGVLAATVLVPTAASAAPPAIPGWTAGSSNGAFAFSTSTGATGTIWSDGSRKAAVEQGSDDLAGRVSAWSADGNRVLVSTADRKTVLDVDPWTASLVETLADPAGNEIQGVSVSPDGRTYAWGTPGQGFRVGTPYDPATTVLPHGSAGTAWSTSDRLAWINDDRDADETNDDPGIFVANGASEDLTGNLHLAVLTDELGGERPRQVSLSADGTRLAYSTPDDAAHTDAIRVSSAENGSEARFLETNGAPTAQDRYAAIAPDGTKVAFASDRSGAWALYTANWDGTGVSIVPNTTLSSGREYTGLAWQPSQVPDLNATDISSATEVGSTLELDVIAEQGTAPLVRTYDWQRCDDGTAASCVDTGVTTEGFPLNSSHLGHRYRVVRTVTNPAGADALPSEITTPIEEPMPVDTTAPPKPTIGTKPASVTKEQSAEITFSGNETNGSFECRLGDGSWVACASPATLSNLTDGEKRLSIRQLDEAGNASDPVEVEWTVDTDVPAQPVVTTDLSAVRTQSTVEIAFTGETGATFACSVDDGAFAPCTSPAKLQELGTGPHRFAIRQTDAAGNVGTPREVDFAVDVTGPAKPAFTGAPKAVVNTSRVVFTFTGADADGTGFECAVEGIPGWASCVSGVDVDGLPEGEHTFLVRQIDAHGNRGQAAAHTWKYDATKPVPPTLKDDLGVVRTKETTVGFSGEGDEGSVFACRLDDGAWEACTSPVTLKGYASGPHTFEVRETDAAGNVGTVAGDLWTADFSGPPAPKVKTAPDARTEQTTATVDLHVADPDATTEYVLDDGAWTPTKLPLTLTGLAVGDHVLLVRQTDAAGNHGQATRIAWTVVAPTPVPVETPAPGQTPVPAQTPVPGTTPAPQQTPAPAPAADKPAPTTPAKGPVPAAQPKLSAVLGGTADRGTGAGGTSSAATITVERDGVGVGCAITGTVLTSCRVDLYATAATSRAAGATGRQVHVGSGEYRAKAGSRKMEVDVTLNATGRKLLRSTPGGLKVAVAITGRPAEGKPLTATGAATLVLQRTTATVGGFAVNSATLTQAARRQLTALATQVRGTAVALRVVGHTDGSTTDASYLKGLGLRRARTVAAFLRAHGVQAKAALASQGAKQPRATNATQAGRALNRRVELRIDR